MKRPNAASSRGVAPKASSTAQRWVVQDGQRAQQVVREDGLQHGNRCVTRLAEQLPAGRAYLADPLHRAALSIVLYLAGGAGEFSPSPKARLYRMALRSATECAAIIDASTALGVADAPTAALGRQQLLFATVRMLSRMVQNLKTRTPRKTRRNQPG
ncbi:MAG: four helix bundle protein [Polyangiaceae bacterium]|nr:four helix bundle protein [Polyangiaceae bacterium]